MAMKIGGEEVELVTDFAQLLSGMIVWVKNCGDCGATERYMLLSLRVGDIAGEGRVPGFQIIPDPDCSEYNHCSITRKSLCLTERRLYRVVDPLLDAETSKRAKEMASR
jgi:hypothetical protein